MIAGEGEYPVSEPAASPAPARRLDPPGVGETFCPFGRGGTVPRRRVLDDRVRDHLVRRMDRRRRRIARSTDLMRRAFLRTAPGGGR